MADDSALVAVAVPAPLHTAFDYRPGTAPLAPGCRVRVPFGHRELTGVVLEAPRRAAATGRSYKRVGEVLDAEPLLPAELLALCRWAAAYYQHPIGEVVAAALPVALREGGSAQLARRAAWQRTTAGRDAEVPARAHAQRRALGHLAGGAMACDATPDDLAPTLRLLERKGWVERVPLPEDAPPGKTEEPPALTDEQSAALAALREGSGFRAGLLHGVTGSGKTELYLRRAADVVAAGGQVLVLVPEIGLTPQLAGRFARRFGAAVSTYHSAMADGERAQAWLRARAGLAPVIVGTRSAAFLPFAKLGLVIVDEEHDGSFKQQDGLRYSARDLVIVRAQRLGAPVILGSATPALESLANARAGRYRHVRLTRRVHSAAPPAIRLLDIRGQPLRAGLSAQLLAATGRHLAAGGQALLFINRRGYAPVLLCHACGWQAACVHCDARLTLHRARGRLICHHCGAQQAVPTRCGGCGSAELMPAGQGTERIEETLRAEFPDRRIERLDSDRIRRRGELERLLEDVRSGAIHVLVGTQMLAKGHDFAGLSLVGIVDADDALYGADFRALERMGQLVTQVAGRAGRAGQPGEVLLQTHEPHHAALKQLLTGGYESLCEALLAQRLEAQLPPHGHLALLRAEAAAPAAALRFLEAAKERLAPPPSVSALGPVPAPMERRGGRWRAQLLLQSGSRAALQKLLAATVPGLGELAGARAVRWSVDVDPLDLF